MMGSISMDEAIAIKVRHEQEILSEPGVTGIDVGRRDPGQPTQQWVLRVYVDNMSAAASLPQEIEGLPVDVIERRFSLN